ncbi:MAG: helix-turn-helix domain-containing protein [Rhodospirillales bacterium]|jgi:CRP/FNR family transcriptional activator FtrB|nr:helix-turn-helix domain-containing protein [Rhodospirillales bacterium]
MPKEETGMPNRTQPTISDVPLPDLAGIPLFSRFTSSDLHSLLDQSTVRSGPIGDLLFEPGEALTHLLVLLQGEVELSTIVDGQPSIVDICRQESVLGEEAVFSHDPSSLAARALTPISYVAIPAFDLLALLESRFDLQRHVLSVLSQRLRCQIKQIAELKLKTTAQRLGVYLLSLTEKAQGGIVIDLPHDKKRIAEELGMQPESLSRSLLKLSRIGVNSLAGNRIEIPDLAHLRRFCSTDD